MKLKVFAVMLLFCFLFAIFSFCKTITISDNFRIIETKPRIITPNGDGKNDVFIIKCEDLTLEGVTLSGKVLSLSGAFIKKLMVDATTDPYNPILMWNGKDSDEKAVPSGIYIYQVEVLGKTINGIVTVGK